MIRHRLNRPTQRHSRALSLLITAALVAGTAAMALRAPIAHAATITVTTTADEVNADGGCSLREAIRAANTDIAVDACPAGNGADTIRLPAGTDLLTLAGAGEDATLTGDLDITEPNSECDTQPCARDSDVKYHHPMDAVQHRVAADAAAQRQDRWHFRIAFCAYTCTDLHCGAAEY